MSSMTSAIESQILHTTTTRTLHAHNFTKSSSLATHTLTNVLSRYLSLLAETCARYAQHAGRTGVTVRDALAALEEIGVGIDELREYAEGEANELVRYTGQTARRTEELAEIKAVISEGLKQDHSDAILLVHSRIPDDNVSEKRSTEDENEGVVSYIEDDPEYLVEGDSRISTDKDVEMPFQSRSSSPHLPPSPVSPPHARKRPRTSNWKPPDHIPDFLPPFPGHATSPSTSPQETVLLPTEPTATVTLKEEPVKSQMTIPMALSSGPIATIYLEDSATIDQQRPTQLPPRPPSPALPTSSSASSSYLTSIPYEHSSLSTVPELHLPKTPINTTLIDPPSTLPALLSSHSYLQSSSLSAPSLQPPNPLRHALAMMLLGLSSQAYTPAATLFASGNTNTCAPVPRRSAPLAAHAIPLDKNGKTNFSLNPGKNNLPVPPPDWHARSVAGPVAIVDTTAVQGSRIPILARSILSPPILAKTTRIIPPQPLERNEQKLLYGPPIPAPWNTAPGEAKSAKGNKDKTEEEEEEDKVLGDAHLFAAWDYDPKDFRAGLPMAKRGSRASVPGTTGTNGALPGIRRKRSETAVSSRRGSEAALMARMKAER